MAIARVPLFPTVVDASNVIIGYEVDGRTHQAVAGEVNHLLGRGGQLIAAYAVNDDLPGSTTWTFNFKIWPRLQAWRRRWCVWMHTQDSASSYATANVTAGSASAVGVAAFITRTLAAPFVFDETLSSRAAGETTTTLVIENTTAATEITIVAIACVEIPRPTLPADGTDYGAVIESCRGGAPISDEVGLSVGGEVDSLAQALTTARRGALFHWSVDTTSSGVLTTTSGSLSDVFDVKPILLARKLYQTSTTGVSYWRIYAKASDGTTSGEVVLTATSGDTLTITIPTSTTSYTWLPASNGDLDVDCEDLAANDGRRSTRWDEITVQWRRTAGAGTLSLAAMCCGEAP